MLRRVALVRTDVSEEGSASIIRVTRIAELRTTLAVVHTSQILFTLMMEALHSSETPHGVTYQKIEFLTVTA
jgi:hypothetical protein